MARQKYAPLRSSPSLSHIDSTPTAAASDFSFNGDAQMAILIKSNICT
ncbi:hypothetical protein CAMRE0001_1842 [Campylobacter rectus RM3267]|uniref:Uncharacterized protein n=1 Tax=Campylobacter rectus RM3267 TaxID=553218 RepID=B9CYL6_CAMRE|nr:hypothetical protein CAMRE0001_1842 [Campylobacter rectus RM3267]